MTIDKNLDEQAAIAVIGMANRFPGASTPEGFWSNLCEGVQSARWLSDDELAARGVCESTRHHPNYVPVFSGPDDIDKFDASFFGITPGEAECLDPQHRLLLECSHEALQRAGVPFGDKSMRVGVFGGVGVNGYLFENLYSLLPDPFDLATGRFSRDMQVGLGNEKFYACSRISHKLDLRGPSVYVEAACATSLVAVHIACKSLLDFECDAAVAGGAKTEMPYGLGYMYEEGGMTSPEGSIRAFGADAKGTLFASGAGVVVLKRLEDARRDGDPILALIRSSAMNNDGADKVGFTAPSFEGQRNVILEALAFSGISADSIGYVETHGTGTPLGDPIEIAALTAAYRTDSQRAGYCAIGSLKPNVGHMETAAGVASLIKAVLALHHRKLPPSLNFERANPEIDFDNSPFFVNTELRDWDSDDQPRRAAVSSFGVGGSNAHVILEEYTEAVPATASRPWQLLVWSAKTDRALDASTLRIAEHLRSHPDQDLADVAHTLQRGREVFSRRRMLVCDSRESALLELEGEQTALASAVSDGQQASVAFMFPGQGAQHIGMASSLYRHERVFRSALEHCADLLEPWLGLDLRAVLYPPSATEAALADRLGETWLTQPALFSVEYALACQWQAWGVEPTAMLGHSIGEYVAACLAGVFTLPDALELVSLRGRLMQDLPGGDMLAVALAEEELGGLAVTGWDLAAVNGPRACVLSGPVEVVDALEAALTAKDVQARRLRTSHAFHSAMMEPILETFGQAVEAMTRSAPQQRFISNVSGDWITSEQALSSQYWVRHLRGTVRFADGVQRLLSEPGTVLLEAGPGQTLSALARQQSAARGRTVVGSLPHPQDPRDAQASVLSALGHLWLAGVPVDWAGFYADETRRRVLLPTYPYDRKRYWIDPPKHMRGQRGAATASGGRLPLADWFHVPGWAMAPRPCGTASGADGETGKWLMFSDAGGLGNALAAELRARGDVVIEVVAGERFEQSGEQVHIRLGEAEDYDRLLALIADGDQALRGIVHALCVDESQGDYASSQQLGFYSLLYLAQALGRQSDAAPLTLTVLSSGLADVTGTEPLDPMKGSVLGPVKVIAQEYPYIACRQIDVIAAAGLVKGLVKGLVAELGVPVVPQQRIALRGVHRWCSDMTPLRLDEGDHGALPWRAQGVYLITGGLGGLGLVFAEKLARQYHARLVLIGRQTLPPREEWQSVLSDESGSEGLRQRIKKVMAIEAVGGEVLPIAADVTDAGAMRNAVAMAKANYGVIHGAMHAAGIAGGGIMQRRSDAETEGVLAPKIRGAQVLFKVLADEPVDIIILHSSLFAITGGAGQVDYCGANNALDLMARAHARQGMRVVSLNWDGWSQVGMAARAEVSRELPADNGTVVEHPLLGRYLKAAHGDSEFIVELDANRHWVVDEHRMDGQPTMPGTALIEMAHAAFRHDADPVGAIELRDVLFLAPLKVDPVSGTKARVLLSRDGHDTRFRIQSQSVSGWRDHAVGAVKHAEGASEAFELASLRERHQHRNIDFEGHEADVLPSEQWLKFGKRWHSVKRIDVGDAEAIIELALPDAYAEDVGTYALHPAMLDLATGLANGYWLDVDEAVDAKASFLPFGYERITVWQDLPARIVAHCKLISGSGQDADTMVFNILLADRQDNILVTIEGFTLKRMDSEMLAGDEEQARDISKLAGDVSSIAPEEGNIALDRVLAHGEYPQIIISTRSPQMLIEQLMSEPEAEESQERNERPDMGSTFAAPRTKLEQELVAIWESLLGMNQVGINDNFFELGGDSLLATQIPNRIRSELDIGIDLGLIFQSPTVAKIAEHINAKIWAADRRVEEGDEEREVGAL
jgi:phthiocerol/phenolphthiocerol synthesis type-I polyketide synthase E